MKYTIIALSAAALFVLTACEGKKSLDGHPMDKPPPSAFAPRDSEPVFAEPVVDEDNDAEEVAVDVVDEVDEVEADEGEVELEEDEADADEEVDEE